MIVIIIILTVLIVAAITIGLVFGLKKSNKSGPGSVNPSPPHSGPTPPHSGPTPPSPPTQSPYGPRFGDLGINCQKDSDCVLSGSDTFCNSQTNRCELRECPKDMKDWGDCGTFSDEETCNNGYSNNATTIPIGAAQCSNTVPCYVATGKIKCNWAGTYCTESASDTICAKSVTRS